MIDRIMKRVMVFVNETAINRFLGGGLPLSVPDDANVVHVIERVDEVIGSKGGFPLPEYGGLLHMVYNPVEDRFYTQVGIHAYTEPGKTVDVRNDIKVSLQDGMQIIISPQAGCIGDWEDVLSYERFREELRLRDEEERG